MAKLAPPLIEGVIPAFYSNSDGTATIAVPFSMNRAVNSQQINGFVLRLKTVQSSSYLFTSTFIRQDTKEKIDDSPIIYFDLSAAQVEKLNIGQFYKCQIAYINNEEIGHYSTVGLTKYTTKPSISIKDLDSNIINMHSYEYMGLYSQEGKDYTERVYTYNFKVYDSKNNLIAESGELLHNSQNDDTLHDSYDTFFLSLDLELNQSYFIQYTITTNNGMVVSSPRYRIMQKISLDPEIQASLAVTLNYNNGYVDINLVGEKNADGFEEPVTGGFLLTRACEDSGYSIQDEISRFKLAGQLPSRWLWRDYTTEQGKKYKYGLQQYNDAGLYSNRIMSNELYSDFEDAFLYDGQRQLKIRFNPKVTSFKPNVLETKTNTIGSKHPFIFRNGQVYYREFPISGLISYQMDEEKLFYSVNDPALISRSKTETNDLPQLKNAVSQMIANERDFKMEVLEWLTDGKPKLFRSPGEGNFIVRLMNVSLSPNDALGRMLHTFNATAYEVADFNYENLSSYNFIHLENPEVESLRWETVQFFETSSDGKVSYKTGVVNLHTAYTVKIVDLMPGDYIYIITDPTVRFDTATPEQLEPFKVLIGATGSYFIDSPVAIGQIALPNFARYRGSMTYSYYSILQNTFNKIAGVTISEVPIHQFIGEHDIIKEIEYVPYENTWLKNPKIEIVEFYNLQVSKRFVDKTNSDNPKDHIDLHDLYAIGNYVPVGQDYRPGYENTEFQISHYRDPANGHIRIERDNYNPALYINGEQISVYETENYSWVHPGKLNSLTIGNGVIAEVSYQIRIIDYLIEDDQQWNVYKAKEKYLKALDKLNKMLDDPNYLSDEELGEIDNARVAVKSAYNEFIVTLVHEQEAEKVADGLL